MVDELEGMGIKLMVSIWPTVEEGSENFKEMEELGYLSRNDYGKRMHQLGNAAIMDPTNPDAENMCGARLKRIIMTTAYAFSGWMRRNRNSPTMNTATIVFTWAQIWKSAIFSPGNTREWPMKHGRGSQANIVNLLAAHGQAARNTAPLYGPEILTQAFAP